jgi:hypothetical protein
MTRESIHFNSPSHYYPLAHIAEEAQNELQDVFNTFDIDFYSKIVNSRLRKQAYLNRARVPQYFEGQLVFLKNLEPAPGSTILKLPYKGPYRVKSMEARNVTLIDLESGRESVAHVEFLKPLSLKEFRLVLNKGWILNDNREKRTRTRGSKSSLDLFSGVYDLDSVFQEESSNDQQGAPQASNNTDHPSEDDPQESTDEDEADDQDHDPQEGTSSAYLNLAENQDYPCSYLTGSKESPYNDLRTSLCNKEITVRYDLSVRGSDGNFGLGNEPVPPAFPPANQSVCLPVCLPACLPACPPDLYEDSRNHCQLSPGCQPGTPISQILHSNALPAYPGTKENHCAEKPVPNATMHTPHALGRAQTSQPEISLSNLVPTTSHFETLQPSPTEPTFTTGNNIGSRKPNLKVKRKVNFKSVVTRFFRPS